MVAPSAVVGSIEFVSLRETVIAKLTGERVRIDGILRPEHGPLLWLSGLYRPLSPADYIAIKNTTWTRSQPGPQG